MVLVITVADAIIAQLLERFTLKNSKQPIFDTIRATWLPCLLHPLTAVGLEVCYQFDNPLNQYGIQSFFVMIFAYVIVMTFVPFLLKLMPPKVTSSKDIQLFPKFVDKTLRLVETRTRWIVIGC